MPSRSLWVPFELGRPFGVPNEPKFQMDVLRSLLDFFARESGPLIEDYPHDAPVTAETNRPGAAPCHFHHSRKRPPPPKP